ncbi:MAG: hypothetical protein JXQ75_13215 [Phycisphaerae bacterium]|nr:hypothetical protein [Phycisphaerae bacterium]
MSQYLVIKGVVVFLEDQSLPIWQELLAVGDGGHGRDPLAISAGRARD